MKRKIALIIVITLLTMIALTSCGWKNMREYSIDSLPYSLKVGLYGFEKAIIVNLQTEEVIEKTLDDLLERETGAFGWRWMGSFDVLISQDTKFICIDNRFIAISEGLAYELIGDYELRLCFPHWHDYNYSSNSYRIEIFLGFHELYG